MDEKLIKNTRHLYKDTLKMRALNIDELQTIQQRQNTVSGYQALNYILLYNSPAMENKTKIPAQYRISTKGFLKLYKTTLWKLHSKLVNNAPVNKRGITNYLRIKDSIRTNGVKVPNVPLAQIKKAYKQAYQSSNKLLKEMKYLDDSIKQYSITVHPLLKDVALPKYVRESSFVNMFANVLKSSQKRDSNV